MERRSLLKLGLASATLLVLAGGGLALLQPGIQEGRLSGGAREVFAAVGRAILDGSLPDDAPGREAAMTGLLDRIDGVVAALPLHARRELSQLLALLSNGAGRRAVSGLGPDWSSASIPEAQQALQGMRGSSLGLRQQAYHALHDIVTSAYFAGPETWAAIGYPGPVPVGAEPA